MTHIFFDIDGVLIDGFHTKKERQNRWDKNIHNDLGINPAKFQEIFKDWFLEVLQGRLGFEQQLNSWLHKNGYALTARQVIDYWHEKDSNLSPAFSIVEKLSGKDGIKLYTATNQTHERIAYLRDVLGWGVHFTDFYYSARLGCLKHDEKYFVQIENELKFNPQENAHLYFDDDSRNIEVSSKRGWNAVLVDGPEDVINHPLIQRLVMS